MADLFGEEVELHIPRRVELSGRVHGARIEKLAHDAFVETVSISPFAVGTVRGFACDLNGRPALFVPRKTAAEAESRDLLLAPDAESAAALQRLSAEKAIRWLRPKPEVANTFSLDAAQEVVRRVSASWHEAFSFKEEVRSERGVEQPGLRPPQIGALYATLAHWSVSSSPATVVMPTGTGKTETMLALLTAVGIEKLMVVVPNAALRDQISEKFRTLGILRAAGVLKPAAELPIVASIDGRPRTVEEVDEIFQRANVIVTTMNVAGQCEPEVQERMAHHCSHLFIDEAHHIAASTWQSFKAKFGNRRVVQFTATPFRTDGKRVDGKFIYVYPLKKAQEEGYFRPITFDAVQGLDLPDADREVATRVVRRLRSDRRNGLDHIAMARCRTIERAKDVYALYERVAEEFSPVCIHSRMSASDRKDALSKIHSRESRLIVCVDMFGEGFDLPQLKIAGIHDRHKSVAITLQFTGRFTRDAGNIGDATVIANIEQDEVEDALRSLYAEDADWNFLLRTLAEQQTGRQLKRAEIIEGFQEYLEGVPLQTLFPKMSTVVYETSCTEWRPQNIEEAFPLGTIYRGPVVNEAERLAVFVTRDEAKVRWSSIKELVDVEWNLYLVHWDPETQLLYINSSKTKDLHEPLANAVGGTAQRIRGERVYRVLHGINRLMLTNLGLSSALGRRLRYTMFIGTDITSQIEEGAFRTKRKSNLFGLGYDGSGKVTIGCSAKGKIWSYRSAGDFSEWMDWSHSVGAKLADGNIATDDFVANLVLPKVVTERPDKTAVSIHWPDSLLTALEEQVQFRFGDSDWVGFYECEIELEGRDTDTPIRFSVSSELGSGLFEVRLDDEGVSYPQVDGPQIAVRYRGEQVLAELFGDDSPHIYFADGDFLIFNELFSLPQGDERVLFSREKIETRPWTGVDIRVESQGPDKRQDSIQRAVIDELLESETPYDVIFDDDGPAEIADVVAMKRVDGKLEVDLFHCKFSHAEEPGDRMSDLYEVCGQAQKSIRWAEYPVRILKRLRKRESDRMESGRPTGFEQGDMDILKGLIGEWRELEHVYRIWIVQPGLRKSTVAPRQLDLLSATEALLMETYGVPLRVIAST